MRVFKAIKLQLGDWLILIMSLAMTGYLFSQYDSMQIAQKVQIKQGHTLLGTYTLNQQKRIVAKGPLGDSIIEIKDGKARFAHAPCHNQYCVHQGWLKHAGQLAVCLPNQVTLQLLGEKGFDSLSY
jgi:hypothetical protein